MFDWIAEEDTLRTWSYKHYDGSKCKYNSRTGIWQITVLPPLSVHSAHQDKIGEPCRYCNAGLDRTSSDPGVSLHQTMRNQVKTRAFAYGLVAVGLSQIVLAILLVMPGQLHRADHFAFYVTLCGCFIFAALAWCGIDFLIWNEKRNGELEE